MSKALEIGTKLIARQRWSLCLFLGLIAAGCDLGDSSNATDDGELQIAGGAITMSAGESVQLKIVPVNSKGQPVSDLYTITWTSANAGVASTTSGGLLTGVAAGSTQVTALATVVKSGVSTSASVGVTVVAGPDSCGTGTCSTTETCTSCPADCGACVAPGDMSGSPDMGPVTNVDAGPQTPVTFTALATDPDLIAPGRGAEQWNNVTWDNGIGGGIEVPNGNTAGLDAYYRFAWPDIETTTQGGYDFTKFDQQINSAIDKHQKFSFSVMNLYTGYAWMHVDGADLSYPLYLHNQMHGDTANNQDWIYNGAWIPNWNSTYYLVAWENMLKGVAAHIATGTHAGVAYKNVIGYIDIRGYGDFGEWHTWPWCQANGCSTPTGRTATVATLKRIIDSHATAFPSFPLVNLIGVFDGGNASLMPAEVSYYALTQSNNVGKFGWRRDNWGDSGYDNILVNNDAVYNGTNLKDLIMGAWKYARIVGEPSNDPNGIMKNGSGVSCGALHCDLEREVKLYHATSFGNGNFPNTFDTALQTNVRAASKDSGYRLALASGSVSSTVKVGGPLGVTLGWQNLGIAPTYEDWNVVFELRNAANTAVWSGTSTQKLKTLLPAASATSVQDVFVLPASVAAGTYSLVVVVRDPSGYRKPLPLAVQGRATDGSYVVASLTIKP